MRQLGGTERGEIAVPAGHEMAPKRKAPASNNRPSKRVASGVSTPISIGSDGDFSGSEDNEGGSAAAAQDHKYDGQ